MRYRKEIDGLRAVAVVPVILFHAGISVFGGGFVGVDVFFVISGYLITTIILTELEEGRFSLWRFYERRARRILPALCLVMLCCIPFALAWMRPMMLKDFAQSLGAVSLFSSNMLFWWESGYFGPDSDLKPLLHTWSLAIEEQYYLIFPLCLMGFWRFGQSKICAGLILVTLLSLGLSHWAAYQIPSANFYLFPFRAWELLVGSLCAFALLHRPPRAHELGAATGLGLIVISILLYDHDTPFPSLYALAPVGGTALIILFATPDTRVGRLLCLRGFVGIGLVSYSAYLWHQPLFAFARIHSYGLPDPELMGVLALASLGLAYLSWRYVEAPFRAGGRFATLSQMRIFALSISGLAGFLALGALGHMSDGRRAMFLASLPPAQQDTHARIEHVRDRQLQSAHARFDDDVCVFDIRRIDAAFRTRARDCHARFSGGVLVLGDSHAIDLYGTLTEVENRPAFMVGAVSGGCRPHTPRPGCDYYEDVLRFIRENPDVFERVIYEQAGFYLLHGAGYESGSRSMFQKPLDRPLPAYQPNGLYLDRVTAYLDQIAALVPTIWLGPRIEPHYPLDKLIFEGCEGPFTLRPGQREIFTRLDEQIAQRLAGSNVEFVSQNALVDFNFSEDFATCEAVFWADGDHFSWPGQAYFAPRLAPLLTLPLATSGH